MPDPARALLGGLSARGFLHEYWQRKPLLVRGGLPGLDALLPPEELAGLALESEIESRLVLERGRVPWELRRGPFTARDFSRLPPSHRTLLVQAVDQWLPAVRAVRDRFRFLPEWRFDDIMVSYAVDRGGVGPHFDWYDVFLIQASGRRRWRIGQACDASTPLRDDTELRILKRFETVEEYLLEPGDLLYLPPGLAHWGVADGPCTTWSIGFRAPSHAEILQEIAAAAAERLPEQRRFGDAGVVYPADGRIPRVTIAQLRRVLRESLDDEELLADWFGRYMTGRKYPELEIAPPRRPAGGVEALLRRGGTLARHPASRFAWTDGSPAALYCDGERFDCEAALARLLCSARTLDARALAPFVAAQPGRELLDSLLARGALGRG